MKKPIFLIAILLTLFLSVPCMSYQKSDIDKQFETDVKKYFTEDDEKMFIPSLLELYYLNRELDEELFQLMPHLRNDNSGFARYIFGKMQDTAEKYKKAEDWLSLIFCIENKHKRLFYNKLLTDRKMEKFEIPLDNDLITGDMTSIKNSEIRHSINKYIKLTEKGLKIYEDLIPKLELMVKVKFKVN